MKTDARFPRLHIVDHPLIQHKLTIMRQKETSTNVFRQLLHEITVLMGYELTRDLPLSHRHIETPIGPMQAPTLSACTAMKTTGRWSTSCGFLTSPTASLSSVIR